MAWIIVFALAAAARAADLASPEPAWNKLKEAALQPPAAVQSQAPVQAPDLIEKVGPGVVAVTIEIERYAYSPILRRKVLRGRGTGLGTGYVVAEDGLIVTNAHVVASGGLKAKTTIHFSDKTTAGATVVGFNKHKDIALLKLDQPKAGLRIVELCQPGRIRQGDTVIAIGSPMNLLHSASLGIVSYVDRTLGNYPGRLIQTDTAINPGNSGGPLFSLDGCVAGMNSMKLLFSENLGFAISVDYVWRAIKDYRTIGRLRNAWTGIEPAQENIVQKFLGPKREPEGVVVAEVAEDSPADKASIEPGNVIKRIGSIDLSAKDSEVIGRFLAAIEDRDPGDTIKIAFMRDSKVVERELVLGERPDEP